MMKKIWAILLSICLLVSLATPALAAPIKTSGAASTLKLESVTGTAQLKDGSGKTIKANKGTQLYNGYELATKKSSYAFVSLDNTKAVKLDASTSTEVFQSGKKLELKVNSGQMFFNVTEPLKSDEALTIRTSTMVTGVRGTSGWISVIDRFTTQISLLEGELTVTSTDPLTGAQRTITIVGGQTATIVYHGKDKNYESEIIIEDKTIRDLIDDGTISDEHIIITDTGLTVETLQEKNVPGFVAVEVKKDKALQQKIEENSPLSVPVIIGDAEQRLENEKAAAEAADKAIQKDLENLTADKVDPLFETAAEPSGGGGSSSGGGASSGGGVSGDETTTYYALTVKYQTADGASIPNISDEVTQIAANTSYNTTPQRIAGYTYIGFSGDAMSGTMDTNKTITFIYALAEEPTVTPTNYTLTVNPITLTYDQTAGNFVESAGDSPTIQNATDPQTITAPVGHVIASVTGNGVEYSLSNDKTSASITMDSNKEITVTYLSTEVSLTSPSLAQIDRAIRFYTEYSVRFSLPSDTSITLNITGDITSETRAEISIPANYIYIVNLSGTTTLDNNITLNTAAGTQLNVTNGIFTNNGTISGQGTMKVADNATVENNGTITIESTNSFHIYGTVNNYNTLQVGTANHLGKLVVESGGSLTNNGSLSISADSNDPDAGSLLDVKPNASITTSNTIQNSGVMTVAGTISGSGLDTASPYTIYNTGTLNVEGGSVTCMDETVDTDTSMIMYSAICAAGGSVTVQSGTVSGRGYGINSAANGGGIINIKGGTVSGECAVDVAGALNMDAGTLAGGTTAIQCRTADAVVIDGGTLSTSNNEQSDLITGGAIQFNSGTLQGAYDDFLASSLTYLGLTAQAVSDNLLTLGESQYALEHNVGFYVFPEFAASDALLEKISDTETKSIYLMAGGELTNTAAATELNGSKKLVVSGGTLTIAEGVELAVSGALVVSEGAEITCEGTLSSKSGSTITNNGEFRLYNVHPTSAYSEVIKAAVQDAQEVSEWKGQFTNGTAGTFSLGAQDDTGKASQYGGLLLSGTAVNNGEIYVNSLSGLNNAGTMTNNGILTVSTGQTARTWDPATLELTDELAVLTNNGIFNAGGLIKIIQGTLVNSKCTYDSEGDYESGGMFLLEGVNAELSVVDGSSVNNLGEFYVANSREIVLGKSSSASKPTAFTNSGLLSIAGIYRVYEDHSLTNTATGTILVGDFYNNALVRGTMLLPNGSSNLNVETTNLGAIYIAPGSSISHSGTLYNAGTIELGSDGITGPYANATAEELQAASTIYNYGIIMNGYSSAGKPEAGYLNLLSGTFENMETLACSASGYINGFEDRTYTGILLNDSGGIINRNESNLPVSGFKLFNDGEYMDEVDRSAVYMMVSNPQWDANYNAGEVFAYGPASDILTAEDFTWTGNYLYQLIPCGATSVKIGADCNLPAITTETVEDYTYYHNNITLDLNGCTLALPQPLVLGAEDKNEDGSSSGTYTGGHLIIRDNSEIGGGTLTVHDPYFADGNTPAEPPAPASQVIVVRAGSLSTDNVAVELDVPSRGTSNVIAPIYVSPIVISTTTADTDVSLSDTTVLCRDGNPNAITGNGIVVQGSGSEISLRSTSNTTSSKIMAESAGIDISGSGHALYVYENCQVISSGGSGVSVTANTTSASSTRINASGATAMISGQTNGIINNYATSSNRVQITLTNGATVSGMNCGINGADGIVLVTNSSVTGTNGSGVLIADGRLSVSGSSVITGGGNGIDINDSASNDSNAVLNITGGTISSTRSESGRYTDENGGEPYTYYNGYGIVYTYDYYNDSSKPTFTIGSTQFSPIDSTEYVHNGNTFSYADANDVTTKVTGGTIAIGIFPNSQGV